MIQEHFLNVYKFKKIKFIIYFVNIFFFNNYSYLMLKEMLLMNTNSNMKLAVVVILHANYVFIKLLVLSMQLR
jgi:hypothetical protein